MQENYALLKLHLLVVVFIISALPLNASHIVGGEISYTFIAHNADKTQATFRFVLTLYRDPTGIDYDAFTSFGIYKEIAPNRWETYDVIRNIPLESIIEIERDNDPCKLRGLNQERLQSATYSFEATLEIGENNYMVSYQRCCRNHTINNIIGAGNIGSVYDVVLTSETLKTGNNSPVFKDLPPIFICAGFPLNVDNSATDMEGDEIVYSFCTPQYHGPEDTGPGSCGSQTPDPTYCPPPYNDVVYFDSFSTDNPLGDTNVAVDGTSGLMTGTPMLLGSYVIAVCIEEYRNGILLTRTRRDFEFNVVECQDNLIANVFSNLYLPPINGSLFDSVAYFQSCNDLNFDFINESTTEFFIKDYRWNFYKDNDLIYTISGYDNRDISYRFPSPGNYQGLMIINDGETCSDTAFLEIDIIPELYPDIELYYDSCIAGPVSFATDIPSTISHLSWDTGDGNIYNENKFSHNYPARGTYNTTLEIIDNYGCESIITNEISWNPPYDMPPDTVENLIWLCAGDSLYIYDAWKYTDGVYYDYMPSMHDGCDSIVERIFLNYYPQVPATTITVSLCEGEIYDFKGIDVTTSGSYFDTLLNKDFCDSIVVLDITFLKPDSKYISESKCAEDTIVINGETYSDAGRYTVTESNQEGCDSITFLEIIDLKADSTYVTDEFCEGEYYFILDTAIDIPGEYIIESQNIFGCDSLIFLSLSSAQTSTTELDIVLCENGYYLYEGEKIEEAGKYEYNYENSSGCDSTLILNINLIDNTYEEIIDTICVGDVYPFGTLQLTHPGIYYDTLLNSNGCDSIIVLDLKVGQNLTRIDAEDSLELNYGESIILTPEIRGGDLITQKWFETNQLLSSDLQLKYTSTKDNFIFFESTNELYCVALDSIHIRSKFKASVYIPNVISPDGDGINDLFNIGGSENVLNSQTNIYDRWGNQLYVGPVTEDKKIETGWDGNYKGRPVEIGVYTYVIYINYTNSTSEVFKGDVTVIN